MSKSIECLITEILKQWRVDSSSVILLTGAGLSVSAGVPLWNDVKKDLYKDLFDIDDPDRVEKEYLYDKFCNVEWLKKNVLLNTEESVAQQLAETINTLKRNERPLPPELVLSFFKKQYGIIELQNFLARHFESDELSASYISLIKLAKLRLLKFYITLNQDGLFEKHLAKNISPTRFLSLTSKEDFDLFIKENKERNTFIEKERILIANLHGVYYKPLTLELSPKVLIEPLSDSDPRYEFLKIALNSASYIIIIGYKASDLDIVGALKKLLTDKINIIWVSPSGKIPQELKNVSNSIGLSSTSDEFLSYLASRADEIKLSSVIYTIPNLNKEENSLICSAPGSTIVMGDYGVYINGKMVQIQIPLRVYAIRSQKTKENEDNSYYYDPYIGKWICEGNSIIKKIRVMIQNIQQGNYSDFKSKAPETSLGKVKIFDSQLPPKIEQMFEEIRNEVKERNCDLNKFSITTYSEFPTASGAGDTLPSVILAAMFLQSNNSEIKLEELSEVDKKFLVKLSKLYTWLHTYSNASHLRILPTFWNKSPLFILDRTAAENEAFLQLTISPNKNFNSREYMQMNLLIDTYSILENGIEMKLPDTDHNNLDFMVAYYPRRAILSKEIEAKTTTATGVYAVNYDKEKPILEVLASLTDAVIDSIQNRDYIRMGKVMTAGHFGLVSLLRGSRVVNEFIGALCAFRGIYGAKTSGGGPGGALLIAYNPKEMEYLKIKRVKNLLNLFERFQHKILCKCILNVYDERNCQAKR